MCNLICKTQLIVDYQQIIESSNDPETLTNLFRETITHKEEEFKPIHLRLIEKISALGIDVKLNKEQLENIIALTKKYFCGYVELLMQHIASEAGIEIFDEDGLILIKFSDPQISLEELSKHITSISEIYDRKIAIECEFYIKYNKYSVFKNFELREFLKKHGINIRVIQLGYDIDKTTVQEAIKSCPHVREFWLNGCFKITSEDLSGLDNLINLRKLFLIGCFDLREIKEFPERLNTLSLCGCMNLKAIQNLPQDMIALDISFCQSLEELKALPYNLCILNISYCINLNRLPERPFKLEHFRFEGLESFSLFSSLLQYDFETGLEFFAANTGVNVSFFEDTKLSFTIKELKISLMEISQHITTISEVYPECKIVIDYTSNREAKLSEISELIENHGKEIFELRLENIDDELFQKILQHCSNVQLLTLGIKNINPETLADLCKLTNVKSLSLEWGISKELPKLPENLKELSISFCESLTAFPEFPRSMKMLTINACHNLTDEVKIAALVTFLKTDFANWLENICHLEISDGTKLFKTLAEQITGKSLQENQNARQALVNALEVRLNDSATDPTLLISIANFVCNYLEALLLNEEHPLMQHAIEIIAFGEAPLKKNPFQLFVKLKELAKKPSNFQPKVIDIEGVPVYFNMSALQSLSQASRIPREDLPKNVDRDAYDKLRYNLRDKVIVDQEGGNRAFEELNTDWATIETPILRDGTDYLAYLLELKGSEASEVEAKWRAILSNILDKSQDSRQKWLTEQEETFVLTIMGIQHCQGGKSIGISLSYDQLETKYRYKTQLSKPTTVKEMQKQLKIDTALDFVRSHGNTIEELVNYVNADLRARSQKIYVLISDTKFWTEDLELNVAGARELLKCVKRADLRAWMLDVIIRLINQQFDGTNALMQKLTGVENIENGSHQAIYLKNLIGHIVGACSEVVFDRHTLDLYEKLLEKSRDEVLEAYCDFVTPETFVNEVLRVVNEQGENRDHLRFLLEGEEYWDEGRLKRLGALVLLQQYDIIRYASNDRNDITI